MAKKMDKPDLRKNKPFQPTTLCANCGLSEHFHSWICEGCGSIMPKDMTNLPYGTCSCDNGKILRLRCQKGD